MRRKFTGTKHSTEIVDAVISLRIVHLVASGHSSVKERQAHNLEVAG